eukprot:1155978-Pelagomonas_calceolata.AAC.3
MEIYWCVSLFTPRLMRHMGPKNRTVRLKCLQARSQDYSHPYWSCLAIHESSTATGRGNCSGKSCGPLPGDPHELHGFSCLQGLHADGMAEPPPPGCVVSPSAESNATESASLPWNN